MAEVDGMNFASLRQFDPQAKRIIDSAIHVALYHFVNDDWEKCEIEGALFVYSRTEEPYHKIFILNRLSLTNRMESVTEHLQLQIKNPFVLYKYDDCDVFGMWFYNKEECTRISHLLSEIVNADINSKTFKVGPGGDGFFNNHREICSMLSKVVEQDNEKSSQKRAPDPYQFPVDVNLNLKKTVNQSVIDFFAKASNDKRFLKEHNIQANRMLVNQSSPKEILPEEPLMQHLMSDPEKSVQFIEKQQKLSTPKLDYDVFKGIKFKMIWKDDDKQNNDLNLSDIIQKPLPHEIEPLEVSDSPQKPVHFQKFSNTMKISELPPKPDFLGECLNSVVSKCPLKPEYPEQLNPQSELLPFGSDESSASHYDRQRPLSAPLGGIMKPKLMTPIMFISSMKKECNNEPNVTNVLNPMIYALPGNIPQEVVSTIPPEPLTKRQFVDAMVYLLKNDIDFIDNLHSAYIKCFTKSKP